MSFSRAKVQRFNEIKPPCPTSSRPGCEKTKLKSKPPYTNKEKPCDNPTSDTGSSQSVPCFRTPTLLRKKLKTFQSPKPKPADPLTPDQSLEALKEKIVECENKDAYIKDLTQQLEEFQERINRIERETSGMGNERENFQQTVENVKNEHEHQVKIIREEFRLRLSDTVLLKEKIASELLNLKDSVLGYKSEMEQLKKNFSELPNYLKKYMEQYQEIIDEKQAELNDKENILKILEQNSIEMQKNHSIEIEKLRKEQQVEIQDLEFEMLQTMTQLQKEKESSQNKIREIEEEMVRKVKEMREIFENDKRTIICQSEKEIFKLEESLQKFNPTIEKDFERKRTELETEYNDKLQEQQKQSEAILKECQAISEFQIIQCELEKNVIAKELKENIEELKKVETNYDDILKSFTELKTTYEELKKELNSNREDLKTTKRDLEVQLQKHTKRLREVLKEKAAYEFTIKNSQITIDVLKRRLIHSDKDVEQLKEELAECEKKLLDYEQKNYQLGSELKQAQLFNEELEMQFESTIKLNCADIDNLGTNLLKEVNDYKKEVIKYKNQIQEELDLKKDIIQQLHDAYEMLNKLKVEHENAQSLRSQYKFEMQQSQNELEDYHMREMDWNIIKDKLEFTIRELEDMLDAKILEINDLKKEMELLKEKSEAYRESSEYYQQKVRELEAEQNETGNIHKKYIEMSGKYDVLAWKFEELESENLQNKMKLMKLSDDQSEKETLHEKYDGQVALCNELGRVNETLETQLENRLKEEFALERDLEKMKSEKDALLLRVQQLELELNQRNTPKKSKKSKDEDTFSEPKKWIKKNKCPKEDKENLSSPNRTLNSPLRDRN